ncbi:MAG: hypothetical protein ACFCVK_18850 [Acidimicrobiales bacterium]
MPTITIGTDAFSRLATLQSRAMGHPDLAVVLVDHPLGGIEPNEVRTKAEVAAQLIVERLQAMR